MNKKLVKIDFDKMKDFIVKILDKNKANNIVTIDLSGKSNLAHYIIIASAASKRQLRSLAEIVDEEIRKKFKTELYLEGLNSSEWMIIDFYGVVVHLFSEEARERYNLEALHQKITQ